MAVVSDPISDFLIRFKNASLARKDYLCVSYSKIKEEIARILKEEGYIWNYEKIQNGSFFDIKVNLKYVDKTPALKDLKRVSRPGLRRYVKSYDIPKVLGGMGISIISTSKGLMAGHSARKKKIGGELLAFIW